MVAAFVTSGAVLTAGLVTMVAQLRIARTLTAWEAALEIAKHDVVRFEKAQEHLITAAAAASRYMFHMPEIETAGYDAHEPYLLPISDALGRAREEVAVLPPFEGMESVESAMAAIESLLGPPATDGTPGVSWDEARVRDGVRALSRARSSRLRALTPKGRTPEPKEPKRTGPPTSKRDAGNGGVPGQSNRHRHAKDR